MGTIYANSHLNLAAVDSSDGDGGLFFSRKSRQVLCWKLGLFENQNSPESEIWTCFPGDCDARRYNILSTRAWVCQETLLPPRILSFGQKELRWECREINASETLPDGFHRGFIPKPKILAGLRLLSNDGTVGKFSSTWALVVEEYSHRKLTFASDKLVAIAGVARLFEQYFQSHYLAGMWEEDWVTQ